MKRAMVLIWIAVICLETSLLSQTEAEWDWTNNHFGAVLNSLMPLEKTPGLYVVYRANRDFHTEVPEFWFLIGHEGNSNGYGLQPILSARVRAVDGVSVYDQLMRTHQKNSSEEASSIAKKIKLKTWDSNETACPAIRTQVEKFHNLQSKPLALNSDVIVLHPMNHEFHIQSPYGDMRLTIWDDEHPLVRWAAETRRALESCATM